MPDRILRAGILTSEPVCSLSWAEEVFYRRLHSVADDYGRFSADPRLLRAAAYPLQLDKVSDSDVSSWLASCERAGLIRVYSSNSKRYLEVTKFEQRLRKDARPKFPPPPSVDDPPQVAASRGGSPPYSESESKSYSESYSNAEAVNAPAREFVPPSPQEVEEYGRMVGYSVDGQLFVANYAARGWRDGQGQLITDWRPLVLKWKIRDGDRRQTERREGGFNGRGNQRGGLAQQHNPGLAAPKPGEPRIID